MGLGEGIKEFFKIGKKAESAQTLGQAPQPVITPLNPTDVIQRPIDVANQQQVEQAPSSPSTESKPAA